MANARERDLFIAHLCKALPDQPAHIVAEAARLILRHAKTHGNLAEAECNGPGDWVNRIPYPEAGKIYAEHEARIEKRQQQIERRISAICSPLGIVPDFQGDPRGYTVKLHLPTGAYNTMGGQESGYGVPQ
jgi:hypothetical protein